MKGAYLNICALSLFIFASCVAGIFAFSSPSAIEAATSEVIASLSVIFGLSTAVSTLAMSTTPGQTFRSNDPIVAKRQSDRIAKDDGRTLFRQKALTWATLIAVMLGVVFLVSFETAKDGLITKALSASFAGLSTMVMLNTLYLPNLLTSLVSRNRYLQQTKHFGRL